MDNKRFSHDDVLWMHKVRIGATGNTEYDALVKAAREDQWNHLIRKDKLESELVDKLIQRWIEEESHG